MANSIQTPVSPTLRQALRADAIAGLSLAGLLLPEAVAYAGLAGLPPQAGITALFAGLLCYTLLGTSRFAIVSATSSSAAVLLAATSQLAGGDSSLRLMLSAGLILLCGLLFVAAGLARLGGIASFIAKPVLRGFAFGLALTIVLKQLPHVMGVSLHADGILAMISTLLHAPWNPVSVMLGVGALLMLKLLRQHPQIPAALLVIMAGIGLSLSGLLAHSHIPEVGAFSLRLPAPDIPALDLQTWISLGELAFALTLILYAESYGSITTYALRHGDHSAPNRDLLALGLANLVSGLMHGMPVGAGYSATSANEAAGARSRFAGLSAAIVILLMLLVLLPLIAHTPQPILAAIVIYAVSHTLDPATLRPYFRWRRDRLIILTAITAVLTLGVVNGLLTSIALSLVLLLHGLSAPQLSWLGRLGDSHDFVDSKRHPEAKAPTGLLIARPELPLFFANAEGIFAEIRTQVENTPLLHTLVLSLEESADLDGSSLEALSDFAVWLQKGGHRLVLARVKDRLRDLIHEADLPSLASVTQAWSVDDAVHEALTAPSERAAAAEGVA